MTFELAPILVLVVLVAAGGLVAGCGRPQPPANAAPRATVVLHVTTDPPRPVIVELREGANDAGGCERTPCDVIATRGRTYMLLGGTGGMGGTITLTADHDAQVVIPLHPTGVPQPVSPPLPLPPPQSAPDRR